MFGPQLRQSIGHREPRLCGDSRQSMVKEYTFEVENSTVNHIFEVENSTVDHTFEVEKSTAGCSNFGTWCGPKRVKFAWRRNPNTICPFFSNFMAAGYRTKFAIIGRARLGSCRSCEVLKFG